MYYYLFSSHKYCTHHKWSMKMSMCRVYRGQKDKQKFSGHHGC